MTKSGTWGVTNTAQPTSEFPSLTHYTLRSVATAAGATQLLANSTDDTVVAEANP